MRSHAGSKHSSHSNHSNHEAHVANGVTLGALSNGEALELAADKRHAGSKAKASEPPPPMKTASGSQKDESDENDAAEEATAKASPKTSSESDSKEAATAVKEEAKSVAEETLVIPPSLPRPVAVAAAITTGGLAFLVVSAFGGAEILLGAAVAYGIYRITRKSRMPDASKSSA